MGYFMETGKVKFFNDKKGFGFITMDNGREVFVHQSSIIAKGYRTLKENDIVKFEIQSDMCGDKAVNVELM